MSAIEYVCPPHVWWLQDAGRVVIVDRTRHTSRVLSGIDAVIWDLLCQGRDAASIERSLVIIEGHDPVGAHDALRQCIGELVRCGALAPKEA